MEMRMRPLRSGFTSRLEEEEEEEEEEKEEAFPFFFGLWRFIWYRRRGVVHRDSVPVLGGCGTEIQIAQHLLRFRMSAGDGEDFKLLASRWTMSAVSTKRSLIMTRNRSGSQGAGEVNLVLIGELGSGKSGKWLLPPPPPPPLLPPPPLRLSIYLTWTLSK